MQRVPKKAQIEDEDQDTDEDKKEMEEAEKSMKAKSLKEVSKIGKEYESKNKTNHTSKPPAPKQDLAKVEKRGKLTKGTTDKLKTQLQKSVNRTIEKSKATNLTAQSNKTSLSQANKTSTRVNETVPKANTFQKKNPFGDFSEFESSIDKMEPLIPDSNAQSLVSKIKKKLSSPEPTNSTSRNQTKAVA